jgi:hypothetical protein
MEQDIFSGDLEWVDCYGNKLSVNEENKKKMLLLITMRMVLESSFQFQFTHSFSQVVAGGS